MVPMVGVTAWDGKYCLKVHEGHNKESWTPLQSSFINLYKIDAMNDRLIEYLNDKVGIPVLISKCVLSSA